MSPSTLDNTPMTSTNHLLTLVTAAFVAGLVITGCSKRPDASAAPSPSASGGQTAAAAPSFDQSIAEAGAAMKSGDFPKAVQVLLTLQQQALAPNQAQAVQSQLESLKRNLADAISRNPADSRARIAMDILRRQGK